MPRTKAGAGGGGKFIRTRLAKEINTESREQMNKMSRVHYLISAEQGNLNCLSSYEHAPAYRDGKAAAAAEMGKSWHTGAAVGIAPLVRT